MTAREFVSRYRSERRESRVELPEGTYRDAEVLASRFGDDREDARQFLLLCALEAVGRYWASGPASLRTYLFRCMQYGVINFFKSRRKEVLLEDWIAYHRIPAGREIRAFQERGTI